MNYSPSLSPVTLHDRYPDDLRFGDVLLMKKGRACVTSVTILGNEVHVTYLLGGIEYCDVLPRWARTCPIERAM